MLQCPLYDDPELYDGLFPSDMAAASVEDPVRRARLRASEVFYREEALRCGRGTVLEMACGSGRLTIPLAQEGVDILGADLSEAMLQRARDKAQEAGVKVAFVEADLHQFRFPQRFAAILIPGNSLLHLETLEELKGCFQCVHASLEPRGKLIFDISKWDLSVIAGTGGERHRILSTTHSQFGEVVIDEIADYDSAQQVRHIPQELLALALLDAAGFEVEQRYGEFTREPFQASSPRQVCVCRIS